MNSKVKITGYIAENSLVYIFKAEYPSKTEYSAHSTLKKLKRAVEKCVAEVEDSTVEYKYIGSVKSEVLELIPMVD